MSTLEMLQLAQERINLIIEVNRLRAALQRIQFMNIKPDQKCCEDAIAIAREALSNDSLRGRARDADRTFQISRTQGDAP